MTGHKSLKELKYSTETWSPAFIATSQEKSFCLQKAPLNSQMNEMRGLTKVYSRSRHWQAAAFDNPCNSLSDSSVLFLMSVWCLV